MRRDGFTLVEAVVAMAVTGLIIATAAGVGSAILSGSKQFIESRRDWDHQWQGIRWLEDAFHGLEVGTDSLASFKGWQDSLAFTANVPAARGWTELRRIRLAVRDRALIGALDAGRPDTVWHGVTQVAFGYLLESGERSEWLREWISPATAPLAVRLIRVRASGPDTLLFRIGRRG